MNNITALIGMFNLDPIRVLDIILDIFMAMLVDHWDFFIELLLFSPWKPTKDLQINKIVPNDVVGQILGFKFRYYSKNDPEHTPKGLLLISALLVKHSIVDLEQLYTHLSPDDGTVKEICEKYLDELSDKPRVGADQLKTKRVCQILI